MKKSPLLTIFFIVFLDLVAFGIVIPILPYYSKEYGASALELGFLMACYSGAQFLFAPFWGALSDRWGRRPVLLATVLGGAMAMAATALAGDLWLLFAARFVAGIFGANISTASAYIADVTKPEDRAKGMGIIGAGFGLGFIFGPAIGGILSVYGFHVPILAAAFMGFLNFLLALFVLEESNKGAGGPSRKFSWRGLTAALSRRKTATPIVLFFVNTLAFTQLEVCFGLFVLQRFGYDARHAGWMLAGMGVVGAIIQGGLIGKLARRFGERRLLAAGFFLLAASLVGAAWAPFPAAFTAFLTVVAMGNALVNPSLSSLVSKGAPESSRGGVMGAYQSAGSLARVVGPPISGLLFDLAGPPSPILAASALMALAFMGAIWRRKDFA